MTKVSYIHGVTDKKYPKTKAKKRFINYGSMTDGELRLSLMAEQLNIVAEYYGSEEHKEGQQRIITSLESGISGHVSLQKGLIGKAIAKEIARARKMTRPASGSFLSQRKGKGIGDPLVDLPNCDDLMEWDDDRYGSGNYSWVPTQASQDCEEQNRNLKLINDHLEGSAHHLLYEYYEENSNSTVTAKKVLQRNAVSKLAEITNVDRTNLRLWLRNGVLRNNITHGAPPLQPSQVIEILKSGENGDSSVGAVPLFISIIAAITAAVTATATLINSITASKRQQLLVASQGIGTSTFGPEQTDWNSYSDQNSNTTYSSNSDMMPFLIGGAALLFLK